MHKRKSYSFKRAPMRKSYFRFGLLAGAVGLVAVFFVERLESKPGHTELLVFEAPPVAAPQLEPLPKVTPVETVALPEWEKVTVSKGDNLAKIFSRMDFTPQQVHQVVTSSKEAKLLKKLLPGQELAFQKDESGELKAVQYHIKPTEIFYAWQDQDAKWRSEMLYPAVETQLKYASGKIDDSLFLAGKRAGLDDSVLMSLSDIFSWDIDFLQDIRSGDRFRVLYEEQFVDGEKVGNGPILAASFETRGEQLNVFRWTDGAGRTDYFTPNGKSVRKAFIRTPVKFTRISSKFDLNRKHPVLHKIRAHRGVDYAAPEGTPVKATGDGKIITAGVLGGFGNVIKIQHGSKYVTVYAHLQKFARGMKEGKTVKQGQVIGYVGMTGLATGPHLHYEFQVHGEHRDPLTVALPKADGVAEPKLNDFKAHIAQLESLLEKHAQVNLAALKEQ